MYVEEAQCRPREESERSASRGEARRLVPVEGGDVSPGNSVGNEDSALSERWSWGGLPGAMKGGVTPGRCEGTLGTTTTVL